MRRDRAGQGGRASARSPHAPRGASEFAITAPGVALALEAAALFVLLLTVAMRPLLTETYDSALSFVVDAPGGGAETTPATTAWFDLGVWLAAAAAAVATVLRRQRWRWTGIEIGWLLMLVAAVISTVAASNRRLALNASCDWLTAIVLIMVLGNLCRDGRRVLLVLAVVVASGAASAAKCLMQVGVEHAETRAWYDQNRAEIWQRQGIPLDDPRVELFERRMASREATGFIPFSNAQGSLLALTGFAAAAVGSVCGSRRAGRYAFAALAIALFAVIITTGSRGAMVAVVAGMAFWLLLSLGGAKLRRHWRTGLAAAWVVLLVAVAGVVVLGRARDGLPGTSLTFRWHYWQVTSRIIGEHPWTGVGALNFDRAYMLHKPIAYPEEIKDPHNVLMAVLSQWGLLGGAGLLALMAGGTITAARLWSRPTSAPSAIPSDRAGPGGPGRAWVIVVIAGFVLLRLCVLPGGEDVSRALAFAFFDLGTYGLVWCGVFLSALGLAGPRAADAGGRWRPASACGVVAMLVHNTIGFSLFVPGTLTAFAAVCGVLLAGTDEQPGSGALRRMIPVVVSVVGLLCVVGLVLLPVGRSSGRLEAARSRPAVAEMDYRAAADADALDPTPLAELAELRWAKGDLDGALAALDEAIARDPREGKLHQLRARVLMARYGASGAAEDLRQARAAAERMVALYPESPDGHVGLAEVLAAGALQGWHDWAVAARQQYERALALDADRPAYEIRRWPAARRRWVEQRLAAVTTHPSSGPTTRP